jgi:hypothetical protein
MMTPLSVYSRGWLADHATQPQAVYSWGWLGFPVRRQDDTISGSGRINPYEDPWMGRKHREDDEIMAIISAFLAMN